MKSISCYLAAALAACLSAPISAQVLQIENLATGIGGAPAASSFAVTSVDASGRAVSDNGRYAVFRTAATNLGVGPAYSTGMTHVYWMDRETRQIEPVSKSSSGTAGNQASLLPVISGDGDVIAFYSEASNLVPGDTNGVADIFVHVRSSGVTTRVSVGPAGAQASTGSNFPAVSSNGRYITFSSEAPELHPNANGHQQIYVYDRQTQTSELISRSPEGFAGNDFSRESSLSADGRYVVLESVARNLVGTPTPSIASIFVFDRTTQTMERIRAGSYPSISGDGQRVMFSTVDVLDPSDFNQSNDAYVYDRSNGQFRMACRDHAGAQLMLGCYYGQITGDGKWGVFVTHTNLVVPGDNNGLTDVFIRHLDDGRVRRLSVNASGSTGSSEVLKGQAGYDARATLVITSAGSFPPDVGASTQRGSVYAAVAAVDELLIDGME